MFDALINRVPAPKLDLENTDLRLFLFDARFVQSRGVMCLVKVMNGTLRLPECKALRSYNMNKRVDLFECGLVHPEMNLTNTLYTG